MKLSSSIMYPKLNHVVKTVEGALGIIIETDYSSHVPYGGLLLTNNGHQSIYWFPEDQLNSASMDDEHAFWELYDSFHITLPHN